MAATSSARTTDVHVGGTLRRAPRCRRHHSGHLALSPSVLAFLGCSHPAMLPHRWHGHASRRAAHACPSTRDFQRVQSLSVSGTAAPRVLRRTPFSPRFPTRAIFPALSWPDSSESWSQLRRARVMRRALVSVVAPPALDFPSPVSPAPPSHRPCGVRSIGRFARVAIASHSRRSAQRNPLEILPRLTQHRPFPRPRGLT